MSQALYDNETAALYAPSSSSWWDDGFTRLLLEVIPGDARQIVEIGCGVARTAHSIMPSLPDAQYVGLSRSPQLIEEARSTIALAPFAPRATVMLSPGPTLELPDGATDVVLSVMSLQHEQQLQTVLAEVNRLLRAGGCLVAVEPDNLGQRFYFDGVLEEINDVFHRLFLRTRVARQPADIAIGPRLPQALQGTGFSSIRMAVHAVNSSRMEDAKSYFTRLKRIAQKTSADAGLPPDSDDVVACEQAINRSLFSGLPKRVGHSSHMVPVFRVVAVK